jgi:hypothetical protein
MFPALKNMKLLGYAAAALLRNANEHFEWEDALALTPLKYELVFAKVFLECGRRCGGPKDSTFFKIESVHVCNF